MKEETKKSIEAFNSVMNNSNVFIRFKEWATDNIGCTIFFVGVFLAALFSNGYFNTHFDLDALITLYGVVYAKQMVSFGIDSSLNSTRGEAPINRRKAKQEEQR